MTDLDLSKLPVVLLADGRVLVAPSNRQVAGCVGLQVEPEHDEYDVIVIGGGPAGLASAVYGASEGLRTLLVEREACGGQAGTSSRIENYLGFPAGLSGDELSGRARQQATRFGAELLVTRWTDSLDLACESGESSHVVTLDGGNVVSTRALVLATGVQWRRLDIPGIDRFVGHGVFYGAALTEAISCADQDVYMVGGANSAGQAALYFAQRSRSVTMLVRRGSLHESMSSYLVTQIEAAPNIRVRTGTTVVEAHGTDHLEGLTLLDAATGDKELVDTQWLFIFIGAAPRTDWLDESVMRDDYGFVLTGPDLLVDGQRPAGWTLDRDPYHLETSIPGVFVAGDVRSTSVKRVASAVGEGALAVTLVHQYLERL